MTIIDTFGDILAAFIIWRFDTVGTNIIFRHPLDWTIVESVLSKLSNPASLSHVIRRIPNLGAGRIIEIPPRVVRNHLVIVIVPEVSSPGGPDISEQ